jgi:exonuclease SbcC
VKIKSLKLRGAIGIWKGLGLDEIEIDFTVFEPGLVTITGKNGNGKSTILENLHPFRTMVSRSGSLESHFYLKDSHRILEFEHNNEDYKSYLQIDALTGASKAYLYKGENPLNDGLKKTYDEALEKILGSQDVFFNSVFSGQKSKGIAELKPSERRALFYDLLRLNKYQEYLDIAKGKLRTTELDLAETEGKLSWLTDHSIDPVKVNESLKYEKEKLNKYKQKLLLCKSDLDHNETRIKNLLVERTKAEVQAKNNEELSEKANELNQRIKDLGVEHNNLLITLTEDKDKVQNQIDSLEDLLTEKDAIIANYNKIKGLNEEAKVLIEKKRDLEHRSSIAESKFHQKMISISDANDKVNIVDKERDKCQTKLEAIKLKIADAEKNADIIDTVPCTDAEGDFSSCRFLQNAYKSKGILPDLLNEEIELRRIADEKTEEIKRLRNDIESTKNMETEKFQIYVRDINKDIQMIQRELIKIQEQREKLDIDLIEDDYENVMKADEKINVLRQKHFDIQATINGNKKQFEKRDKELAEELKETLEKIDRDIDHKLYEISKEHKEVSNKSDELKQLYDQYDEEAESIKVITMELEAQLEQFHNKKTEVDELKNRITNHKADIKAYQFLAKAFDKTGIPVLKLENSGLEVSKLANDLLSLFENNFRIVFETLALTKDKKKMKETFDINIVEDDGVTEIANKSGGQVVYLETAIQLAISLVVRKQGREFETAYLDEKDGALDIENAHHYLEMIRKAHALSGVCNTFIITHRPELLNQIPQKIILSDGLLTIEN